MYDVADPTLNSSATASPEMSPIVVIVYLALIVLLIVSMWKVFTKAGKPGWASIVPLYNLYVMLEIADRPRWWLLLFFVPFANIVVAVMLYLSLAKAFGRSSVFGVFGLLLFPYIGFPMLAFGKDQYVGSGAAAPTVPAAPVATPPATPAA